MNRSRLRNKFIRKPNDVNRSNYTRQRNFCVSLLKREKKKYYANLDLRKIIDSRKFWKTVKPMFSEKSITCSKITLIDGDHIITKNTEIAAVMHTFFSKGVEKLDITGYYKIIKSDQNVDDISRAILEFSEHPSMIRIKENVLEETFSFNLSSEMKS